MKSKFVIVYGVVLVEPLRGMALLVCAVGCYVHIYVFFGFGFAFFLLFWIKDV